MSDLERGSRAQCINFVTDARSVVAERLSQLAGHHADIDPAKALYFPKCEHYPEEAELGETEGLLTNCQRELITKWWLAVPQHGGRRARTPNWDIAAKCTVGSRAGLILVEAKAHHAELHAGGSDAKDLNNRNRIGDAIIEANSGLNTTLPGWNLTSDSHYQLCNRFAWGWKVASLGVPVILIYLGFLNVEDMPKSHVFRTEQEWTSAVLEHAEGIVPRGAWEQKLDINGTPLVPLIRSCPAS
jgi:hypothetical protein